MKQKFKILFVVAMILALLFSMNVTSAFGDDIDPEFFFSEIQQVAVSDSSHTIYLMKDGTVWVNETSNSGMPVKVISLTDAIAVTAALFPNYSYIVLKTDGTVWTFNQVNGTPQQVNISDVINTTTNTTSMIY